MFKRKKTADEAGENIEEKSVMREVLGMVVYLLCVLLLTYLVVTFLGQRTLVKGSSMYPTLEDKDNLIVDKISYRFKEPQRFDIIVFPFHYKDETYYIKRIIGMPGETVRIDSDGTIYINDQALAESYGYQVIEDPGIAEDMIQLGADEYFVLGDNRNNSSDSRMPDVGNIKKDEIIGKAWVRIWPLNKFSILRHQ